MKRLNWTYLSKTDLKAWRYLMLWYGLMEFELTWWLSMEAGEWLGKSVLWRRNSGG